MSKIRILPEDLANQIAAGEVVERPASVVKECVENSIDAGACRIEIQVEGAGTRLIRIIDDGEGMDQDDLLLCLERHATSKVVDSSQLKKIETMGFRGEAIPSIASVSRMTIISRTREADLGARAEIRFGQVRRVYETGCARGSLVEIRDLFGNVPARRKFLKTARTELRHIEEVLLNTALARPAIAFSYTVNQRLAWSFSADSASLAARLRKIINYDNPRPLLRVTGAGSLPAGEMAVNGYLLPPEAVIAASSKLRLFVNRRPIKDRSIVHAVSEGLRGFLMKGRRPAGVLMMSLPLEEVDVNVHPTKQEVRFQHQPAIIKLITMAVEDAMKLHQDEIRDATFTSAARVKQRITDPPDYPRPVHSNPALLVKERKRDFAVLAGSDKEADRVKSSTADSVDEPVRSEQPDTAIIYIGQLGSSYLLCESGGELVIIDQHAAHERLIYESLKKRYGERGMTGQPLLFPEMIECSPEQQAVLEDFGEEIAELGVEIAEFGGNSYVIKAVPAMLAHLGPQEIINGIFERYLAGGSRTAASADRLDDVLAMMACKAAIKANDQLHPQEGEELLRKMEEAAIFSHCPHGRPVMKRVTVAEIEKWFKRI